MNTYSSIKQFYNKKEYIVRILKMKNLISEINEKESSASLEQRFRN